MRYKGEFRPSDLLDTSDNRWHALERVLPQLRAGQRAYWGTSMPASGPWPVTSSFSDTDDALPDPLPLGYDTLEAVRSQSDECAVLLIRASSPLLLRLQVPCRSGDRLTTGRASL